MASLLKHTYETILRRGLPVAFAIIAPSAWAFSVAIDPSPLTRVLDNFNDGVDTTNGFNNEQFADFQNCYFGIPRRRRNGQQNDKDHHADAGRIGSTGAAGGDGGR